MAPPNDPQPSQRDANSCPPHVRTPAERLSAAIDADAVLPFILDSPDQEFPYITYSVFGGTETNELFAKVTNGTVTFVDVIASPLVAPAMADRIFGIDVADHAAAIDLTNRMWELYKLQLIKPTTS